MKKENKEMHEQEVINDLIREYPCPYCKKIICESNSDFKKHYEGSCINNPPPHKEQ